MQVQNITNNSFGAKNSYLNQAKKALSKEEKNYLLGLHYDALSRVHEINFLKARSRFGDNKTISYKIRMLSKMLYEELASATYLTKSYKKYPREI